MGYFSSYTHSGRYYTLAHIPDFDDYGLWIHQGVGFSRYGTLKATIVELICRSAAGLTHTELSSLLRIRVHNSLLILVREGHVGRESIEKVFLYVNPEPERGNEQVSERKARMTDKDRLVADIPTTTIIEVLLEIIQAGKVRVVPSRVVRGVCARGVPVTLQQVHQIFARYGIDAEKKTVGSH
jgi:hypothetical protein